MTNHPERTMSAEVPPHRAGVRRVEVLEGDLQRVPDLEDVAVRGPETCQRYPMGLGDADERGEVGLGADRDQGPGRRLRVQGGEGIDAVAVEDRPEVDRRAGPTPERGLRERDG